MRRLGVWVMPVLAVLAFSGAATAATGSISFQSCVAEAGAEGCASGNGLNGLHGVVVSPDGKNVYVAGKYGTGDAHGGVAWFTRSTTTGALIWKGCISEGGADGCTPGKGLAGAAGIAISPAGNTVYVVSDASGAVAAFSRNASTGALIEQGCIAQAGADTCTAGNGLSGATGVAVSPDGQNVYTTSETSNAVATFTIANGAFSESACIAQSGSADITSGSPKCSTGYDLDHAENLVLSPGSGAQLYATAMNSNAVVTFSRNSSGGLSETGCIAMTASKECTQGEGLTAADGIAITPDGTSIYTAAENGSALATFSRTGGTITETTCVASTYPGSDVCPTTAPGLHGLARVAVSPDGANVYTGAYLGYALATFNRAGNGALTPAGCVAETGVSGCATTAPGLKAPAGLTLSPDGRNVYDAAMTSAAVDVFQRTLPIPPPAVATGAATALRPHTATLNGTVNPEGTSATYYFQIGRTTSYAQSTPTASAGTGTSPASVNAAVADLTAGITYHYRVVASNAAGTSYGSDRTFTTPRAAPSGLSVRVKPRRATRFPYRYTVSGKLRPPAGVSDSAVCSGKMTIVVKRGRQSLVRRSVPLSSTCSWKAKLKLGKRRQVPRHGKLSIDVSFPGNTLLAAYDGRAVSVRYG